MPDFTGGAIHSLPTQARSSGDPKLDKQIADLVADAGIENNSELIREFIVTAIKLGSDNLAVADLKLYNRAFKELRYAAKMFQPYVHQRKVVVFGSARTAPESGAYQAAERFSKTMQEHGYMTITGGGDGIMGAAQKGAGRANSFGLNIRLPFEQRANDTIHGDKKLVNFNYFFTRKLNFAKETHAVALFPGGFGTMDEGFEVLTLMQTGKGRIIPLVLVDQPGGEYWKTFLTFLRDHLLGNRLVSPEDFDFLKLTDNVDEAVGEILQFYKNFINYRWVGKRLVIRMQRTLSENALAQLNAGFTDILQTGSIEQGTALPEEQNEPALADVPRLLLTPHQRDFGRYRALINAINLAD